MEGFTNGEILTGGTVRFTLSIDRDPRLDIPNSSADPRSNESNVRCFCVRYDGDDLCSIIKINLVS